MRGPPLPPLTVGLVAMRFCVAAEVRASRLALAKLTAETLALGLGLLGISVPERM